MYSVVIRNGTVVDGTGLNSFRADIALTGPIISKLVEWRRTVGHERLMLKG